MCLPSTHTVEPQVHGDDDRLNHLGSTRNRCGLQRHRLVLPVDTLPIRLEVSSPLRSSLFTVDSRLRVWSRNL